MKKTSLLLVALVALSLTFLYSCLEEEPPSPERLAEIEENVKKQYKYYFIREAGPPRHVEEGLLFTSTLDAEIIELSGDFLNWEHTIPLIKGKYGIFYYLYTKPIPKGKYFYRYRVDGFWINDPLQQNTTFDKNNQRVSYFTLETNIDFKVSNPIDLGSGIYRFTYYGSPKEDSVYFATDRYDWQTKLFPMRRIELDRWEVDVELKKGGLFYSFIVDDNWKTDPGNYNIYYDKEGREMNYIIIR